MRSAFNMKLLAAVTALAAAVVGMPRPSNATVTAIPTGWTCSGNCGSDTADGSITLSPLADSTYEFVTTSGGLTGVGVNPLGATSPKNGSLLKSSTFSATAGTSLNFYFDFITSDSGTYADNAWAALYTTSGVLVSEIYNSITGASIANPKATTVSWLGTDSGKCYNNSTGCGNTGWNLATYTINSANSYYLAFGVTNSGDTSYNSGLAIDGVTIGGKQLVVVPEPGSIYLLGAGLVCVGLVRWRFSSSRLSEPSS